MEWERSAIVSERLRLEPLTIDHAVEMEAVLSSTSLYEFTGENPPSLAELQERYARQVTGRSADGSQLWFNWVIRDPGSARAMGFVQATVSPNAGAMVAELAWLVGTRDQGNGFATEAALAVRQWLSSRDVVSFAASIHPEHGASMAVARRLGLHRTDLLSGGEVIWQG
ncbi:GNAT family N-acetyltransferase [Subtercola sp. PAMC28395]|uniref:GNAT family N-acetyltransferase n=1 Tax=Subtercola sp. PAMC28395 TaxID=2846775 RepID=UPI00209B83AF|nr:GNAT family N-acetyltransferase [Subtercola sp. PAMC28395]